MAGGAGEKVVAPKKVSGDGVGQADTKGALRLNGQATGPVGWEDEGKGGTKEESRFVARCCQEGSFIFMFVNC